MMEETIPLTGSSSSSPFRCKYSKKYPYFLKLFFLDLPLKIKIALYVLIGLVVALSISSM